MKDILKKALTKIHPMYIEAHKHPTENHFIVRKVGSKVTSVKSGDKLMSSDLDDLSHEGHKIKEVWKKNTK